MEHSCDPARHRVYASVGVAKASRDGSAEAKLVDGSGARAKVAWHHPKRVPLSLPMARSAALSRGCCPPSPARADHWPDGGDVATTLLRGRLLRCCWPAACHLQRLISSWRCPSHLCSLGEPRLRDHGGCAELSRNTAHPCALRPSHSRSSSLCLRIDPAGQWSGGELEQATPPTCRVCDVCVAGRVAQADAPAQRLVSGRKALAVVAPATRDGWGGRVGTHGTHGERVAALFLDQRQSRLGDGDQTAHGTAGGGRTASRGGRSRTTTRPRSNGRAELGLPLPTRGPLWPLAHALPHRSRRITDHDGKCCSAAGMGRRVKRARRPCSSHALHHLQGLHELPAYPPASLPATLDAFLTPPLSRAERPPAIRLIALAPSAPRI